MTICRHCGFGTVRCTCEDNYGKEGSVREGEKAEERSSMDKTKYTPKRKVSQALRGGKNR